MWDMKEVVNRRQGSATSLAEAAEASAREAEGSAADAVTVSDNTTTGVLAAKALMPHETHGCLFVGW